MDPGLAEKLQEALKWATPFSGVCFRNLAKGYAETHGILSTIRSLELGGRFNFKGAVGVLYLSHDQHTCDKEIEKYLRANPLLATLQRIRAEIEV
jgi:RES domain-containing protein